MSDPDINRRPMADDQPPVEPPGGSTDRVPEAAGRRSLAGIPSSQRHRNREELVVEQIGRKESRRLKAQQQQAHRIWFGLGMFGLIGWSVAIPTLLGAALGMWIDSRVDGRQSWTLTLLIGGLVLGCINAWRWVREESEIR